MPKNSLIVPSLSEVALALRKTTEALAQELVAPTHEPPSWSEFEWRIARAVAAMQGVSALLCARLKWRGPANWWRFLEEQQHQSRLRYQETMRLLDLIASLALRNGVPVVALKGSALYQRGIYAAGERPMGDIDLLVRCEDAKAVGRLLDACGYEVAFVSRRHEVFQPRLKRLSSGGWGEHIDNPIKIEVHTRIAEFLPVTAVDITELVLSDAVIPGFNGYPTEASLLLHLLLHAAGNMRARALRLIQLHDIALLAARMKASDWEDLFELRPLLRALWWIWAPLHLTARYHPGSVDPIVFSRQDADYPWLLRSVTRHQKLSDISWSNIRIAAFPGLEWSRTPLEALAFVKSRAWPDREARLELRQNAAQIPGAATIPWYGISHGARILRWIFSRPPRVQTLLVVRAALEED
jgi:Uncharacterised nucleotidyltransferase